MKVLIIGSKGFIAKNLILTLKNTPNIKLFQVRNRKEKKKIFVNMEKVDTIFHFAGVNKGTKKEFFDNNYLLTSEICKRIVKKKLNLKFFYTSTIHTNKNTFYGKSKKLAEGEVLKLRKKTKCEIFIYKLPNIFGKGSKPFYNSVVATFCHLLARNKKVIIESPKNKINLLYIDDLIDSFKQKLFAKKIFISNYVKLPRSYSTSVANLFKILKGFQENKDFAILHSQNFFMKKLYATYISYLPVRKTKFLKLGHEDSRGIFYELLKSKDFGQISFVSVAPGETRGNHFHNTKVELFFLVSGLVKINVENIFDKKKFSFILREGKKIPSTITQPGFAHNIVNIGKKEAKLIIWTNEIFNIKKPDTNVYKINK